MTYRKIVAKNNEIDSDSFHPINPNYSIFSIKGLHSCTDSFE